MVDALQGVVNHLNNEHAAANPLLNGAAPPPVIQVDDFDLTRCVFEDEVGEEVDSDGEGN
jgi:hypothetical protein